MKWMDSRYCKSIVSLLYLSGAVVLFSGCDPIKNSFLTDYVAKDACDVNGCLDTTAKSQDLFIMSDESSLVVKKLPDTVEISGKCSSSYFAKHLVNIVVYSGANDSSATINRNNDICNDTDVNNDRCIVPTHDSKTITENGLTYVQCSRGRFSVIVPAVTSCPASPAACSMLVTFQITAGQESYDESSSPVTQTLIHFQD